MSLIDNADWFAVSAFLAFVFWAIVCVETAQTSKKSNVFFIISLLLIVIEYDLDANCSVIHNLLSGYKKGVKINPHLKNVLIMLHIMFLSFIILPILIIVTRPMMVRMLPRFYNHKLCTWRWWRCWEAWWWRRNNDRHFFLSLNLQTNKHD